MNKLLTMAAAAMLFATPVLADDNHAHDPAAGTIVEATEDAVTAETAEDIAVEAAADAAEATEAVEATADESADEAEEQAEDKAAE